MVILVGVLEDREILAVQCIITMIAADFLEFGLMFHLDISAVD